MTLCFYKVRGICPEKNCQVEYKDKCRCPKDIPYQEDKILNNSASNSIEYILKMEIKK